MNIRILSKEDIIKLSLLSFEKAHNFQNFNRISHEKERARKIFKSQWNRSSDRP